MEIKKERSKNANIQCWECRETTEDFQAQKNHTSRQPLVGWHLWSKLLGKSPIPRWKSVSRMISCPTFYLLWWPLASSGFSMEWVCCELNWGAAHIRNELKLHENKRRVEIWNKMVTWLIIGTNLKVPWCVFNPSQFPSKNLYIWNRGQAMTFDGLSGWLNMDPRWALRPQGHLLLIFNVCIWACKYSFRY